MGETYYDLDTTITVDNSGTAQSLQNSNISIGIIDAADAALAGYTNVGNGTWLDPNSNTIYYDSSVFSWSTSGYSTSSPGYYSTFASTYNYSGCDDVGEVSIDDDAIKEEIEKFISNEDEMMPLVKNYLRKYLEKVLDAPDEIINDLIKKDKEIEEQKKAINELKEEINRLKGEVLTLQAERRMQGTSPSQPYNPPYDPCAPTTTTPIGPYWGTICCDSSAASATYSTSEITTSTKA